MVLNGMMEKLLLQDQLLAVMARHKTFRGFQEVLSIYSLELIYKASISFPPTYKYDIGTTVFDTRSSIL
jgi:hypothetical protein